MIRHSHFINYSFLSDIALFQAQEDIEKRFKVACCAYGGGKVGGLQYLSLNFSLSKNCSIEEARRIIVEGAVIFRNNIDSVRMLRPVIGSYPFLIERLGLVFFLNDPETHRDFPRGSLMKVKIFNGKVLYQTCNECNKIYSLYEEPFEEALRIVEEERKQQGFPSLVIPPAQLKEIPIPSRIPKWTDESTLKPELKMQEFINNFCIRFCEKNNLMVACVGDPSYQRNNPYYSFSLYGTTPLELPAAKQLVQSLLSEYFPLLQTAPEIKEFQKWSREYDHSMKGPDFPDLAEVAIKITFWDKDMNPQLPPNIAQILLLNQKLSYYQADPVTHELTKVCEEPYKADVKDDK